MRKPVLAVIGLALGVVLALPGAAGASHDPSGAPFDEDFVAGEQLTDFIPGGVSGPIRFISVFDARSDPDGQNATGTVRLDVESLSLGPGSRYTYSTARVTCLNVTGNRATIGTQSPPFPLLRYVEDNDGAGQDRMGSLSIDEPATTCPATPSIELSPIFGGDITVHDAQRLPTSKDQCQRGGWHTYGVFKNQGDCVSFVATEGKDPPGGGP